MYDDCGDDRGEVDADTERLSAYGKRVHVPCDLRDTTVGFVFPLFRCDRLKAKVSAVKMD
jgi:hypothetical protein